LAAAGKTAFDLFLFIDHRKHNQRYAQNIKTSLTNHEDFLKGQPTHICPHVNTSAHKQKTTSYNSHPGMTNCIW